MPSPTSTPSARAGAAGVSLKLIKLGGITTASKRRNCCQKLGLKINVAAKIAESSIASAAAVHLACAVPNVDWGVSLTHFYLAEDIVRQPLRDPRRRCGAAAGAASASRLTSAVERSVSVSRAARRMTTRLNPPRWVDSNGSRVKAASERRISPPEEEKSWPV